MERTFEKEMHGQKVVMGFNFPNNPQSAVHKEAAAAVITLMDRKAARPQVGGAKSEHHGSTPPRKRKAPPLSRPNNRTDKEDEAAVITPRAATLPKVSDAESEAALAQDRARTKATNKDIMELLNKLNGSSLPIRQEEDIHADLDKLSGILSREETHQYFETCGGLFITVKVMQEIQGYSTLQAAALSVFAILLKSPVASRFSTMLIDLGLIPLVFDAMKTTPSLPQLARESILVLRHLADVPGQAQVLGETKDNVKIILDCMWEDDGLDLELQDNARQLLSLLASVDRATKERLAKAGAIDGLAKVVTQFYERDDAFKLVGECGELISLLCKR